MSYTAHSQTTAPADSPSAGFFIGLARRPAISTGHSYQQGSFSSPVAQPPAGSSLLFGALADSARIKERKNGSYRMVLKGVDEIDWFTDRPDRVAGEWSPKKLLKEWDVLFSDGAGAPNAQATFEVGSKRKLVTFEMFKPKLSDSNQTLSFKVRGIGKKSKDLLTGLKNKRLSDASLFIDDGTTGDRTVTLKIQTTDNEFDSQWTMRSLSSNAIFGNPVTNYGGNDAELDEGIIFFTSVNAPSSFELPVTLKNGVEYSDIFIENKGQTAPWGYECVWKSAESIDYSVDGSSSKTAEVECGLQKHDDGGMPPGMPLQPGMPKPYGTVTFDWG